MVSELFDERNDAVKALLSMAIRAAKNRANMLEFVVRVRPTMKTLPRLMEEGIDSLSLNPDTVVQTSLSLAELKK